MKAHPLDLTQEEFKKYLDEHDVSEYTLLDVRQEWEYNEFHLPGAKHIPLPEVPNRLEELPKDKPTLVYCAAGMRSAAAAGIMCGQNFPEVYNLLGGAMAWEKGYAVGPKALGLQYLSGNETPLEILAIAYGMEANLGVFYDKMAASSTRPELSEIFGRLSKFETAHKSMVLRMARMLDPAIQGKDDLEKNNSVTPLEGGFTIGEFMEENGLHLETTRGALEGAMMLEGQALDLYMRYAEKVEKDESRDILQALAQEEKNHLNTLSRLMDKKILE